MLGKGAVLVLPKAGTEAMQMHLDEISLAVAPGMLITGGSFLNRRYAPLSNRR